VGVQADSVTIHGGIQLGGPNSGRGSADFGAKADDRPPIRPGWLRLALTWTCRAFHGIADLAAGVTAIMAAVRSVT